MKKWIYFVIPVIMLVGFVFIFLAHEEEMKAREEEGARIVAERLTEEKKQKEIAEAKARESARIAQEERAAKEAKKVADRLARQQAIDREIKEATDSALADLNRSQKKVESLEAEFDRLKKERDRLSRETFDLAKQVEAAAVAKRNAELEEQRLVEMIVRRSGQSTMVRMPPPPPPPPPPEARGRRGRRR